MGSHSVICYLGHTALSVARQAGTRFIKLWGWKAELTSVVSYILRCLTVHLRVFLSAAMGEVWLG